MSLQRNTLEPRGLCTCRCLRSHPPRRREGGLQMCENFGHRRESGEAVHRGCRMVLNALMALQCWVSLFLSLKRIIIIQSHICSCLSSAPCVSFKTFTMCCFFEKKIVYLRVKCILFLQNVGFFMVLTMPKMFLWISNSVNNYEIKNSLKFLCLNVPFSNKHIFKRVLLLF